MVLDMLGEVTSEILDRYVPEDAKPKDWDLKGFDTALMQQFGLKIDRDDSQLSSEMLTKSVSAGVKAIFDRQVQTLGSYLPDVQKMVLLQTIDTRWKEHLADIDFLKEGINLRAHAQKDPLIEYKKEAFAAFESLQSSIMAETIEKILKIQLMNPQEIEQQMTQRQFEGDDLDYYGGEDEAQNFSNHQPQQPDPQNVGFPSMQPRQQEMHMSRGESSEGAQKENRAERRRREKAERKRRR